MTIYLERVNMMNENFIELVEYKISNCEDTFEISVLEKILLIFKTSRTPRKTFKKKIDEIEKEIISLKQSSLLMVQFNKHLNESEDTQEDTEEYKKFYSEKIDEIYLETLKLKQKIDYYRWAWALVNIEEDTSGEYIRIELNKDDEEEK